MWISKYLLDRSKRLGLLIVSITGWSANILALTFWPRLARSIRPRPHWLNQSLFITKLRLQNGLTALVIYLFADYDVVSAILETSGSGLCYFVCFRSVSGS